MIVKLVTKEMFLRKTQMLCFEVRIDDFDEYYRFLHLVSCELSISQNYYFR